MSTKDKLLTLFQEYEDALRQLDATACAACYAEDAVYIACNIQPIRGRAAIEAVHEEIMESGINLISLTTTEVEVTDKLAYALQELESDSLSTAILMVLKPDSEGQWKIQAEAEVAL